MAPSSSSSPPASASLTKSSMFTTKPNVTSCVFLGVLLSLSFLLHLLHYCLAGWLADGTIWRLTGDGKCYLPHEIPFFRLEKPTLETCTRNRCLVGHEPFCKWSDRSERDFLGPRLSFRCTVKSSVCRNARYAGFYKSCVTHHEKITFFLFFTTLKKW